MSRIIDTPAEAIAIPKKRLIKENLLGIIGAGIIIALFLAGIFSNFLAPYGMNEIHLADRLSPPSAQFVFGTDNLGRDVLSRVIFGARVSMIVGLAGATLSTLIAVIGGVLCGYIGGRFDLVVQRFVDAFMCFPWLFIVLTIMAILGPGIVQVIFVLGLSGGIGSTRVVRSAVISIKENAYVVAAVTTGCGTWRILLRHILPNVMAPIIILFTLSMGRMILTEASISFLGYGIPPPEPSWGGMLSGSGLKFMLQAPWMAFWPGLTLGTVVFGVNMFGDTLRDRLDPRLRGGLGRYGSTGTKKTKKRPAESKPASQT